MTVTPEQRESKAALNELLSKGGRDVFAEVAGSYSKYPGAISNRECINLLRFAARRRRMKEAHLSPRKKCWKDCVFPHE